MSTVNGARLRQARERKKLAQIDLSRLLGVASSLAGQWERGEREPSVPVLLELARALDVSVDWLLGLTKENRVTETATSDHAQPALPTAYTSPDAVLADYQAPIGLRDLAADKRLVAALHIEADEWQALSTLGYRDGLTQDGYVSVLMVLRNCSVEARRLDLLKRGGRPLNELDSGVKAA